MKRREFLGVVAAGAGITAAPASASPAATPSAEQWGMLVDTTECIGCRKCEYACNEANVLSERPLESFEDTGVFESRRRTTHDAFTVVNRFANPDDSERPTFVKSQCMHCLHPACASACLVGALQRSDQGAVTYDAGKCMGCRYCMVACPFDIPAYEYSNAFTPRVQKCSFCFERVAAEGKLPACAEMCPPMCLTFGKRSDLLALAHQKIAAKPELYVDHVYGEHEVGGTAWLYLAPRPFEEIGMRPLSEEAPPALTEKIQHGIFKMGALPAMLFGLLGTAMHMFGDSGHAPHEEK